MLAYQITINGERVVTAGVQQGVVSAIANWLYLPSGETPSATDEWHAGFSLAALDKLDSEHLKWLQLDVRVGDEIIIKLVETATVDEPTERGPRLEKTAADDRMA